MAIFWLSVCLKANSLFIVFLSSTHRKYYCTNDHDLRLKQNIKLFPIRKFSRMIKKVHSMVIQVSWAWYSVSQDSINTLGNINSISAQKEGAPRVQGDLPKSSSSDVAGRGERLPNWRPSAQEKCEDVQSIKTPLEELDF